MNNKILTFFVHKRIMVRSNLTSLTQEPILILLSVDLAQCEHSQTVLYKPLTSWSRYGTQSQSV